MQPLIGGESRHAHVMFDGAASFHDPGSAWNGLASTLRSHMTTAPDLFLGRSETSCFELVHAAPDAVRASTLADDFRRGMSERPRSIPPKHFYDAVGSQLFDEICELPEYYLTRAERRLLELHSAAIARRCSARELVEIGAGMARKTGLLLDALSSNGSPIYVPFDISQDAIEQAVPSLMEAIPSLHVRGVIGDFTQDMRVFARKRQAHRAREPRLFALLGSTIGNLDETEAPALLRTISEVMDDGDAFLLGTDLVKDARVLHDAYNDAAGVTARFNQNVLTVVNRELSADFDVPTWRHEARYEAERARIEMHLITSKPQTVNVAALGMRVDFEAGESILTEISRKFTRDTVEATLHAGGMNLDAWYTDGAFALALAKPRRGARYSSAAM